MKCWKCSEELKCELCEMRDKEVPQLVRENRKLSERNAELEKANLELSQNIKTLEEKIGSFIGGAGRSAVFPLAQDHAGAAQMRNFEKRGPKSVLDFLKLFKRRPK